MSKLKDLINYLKLLYLGKSTFQVIFVHGSFEYIMDAVVLKNSQFFSGFQVTEGNSLRISGDFKNHFRSPFYVLTKSGQLNFLEVRLSSLDNLNRWFFYFFYILEIIILALGSEKGLYLLGMTILLQGLISYLWLDSGIDKSKECLKELHVILKTNH